MHQPQESVAAGRSPSRVILAAALGLAVISLATGAETREPRSKRKSAAFGRDAAVRNDAARSVTGIVGSYGVGFVVVDGRRYDVRGAIFVASGGAHRNLADLRVGGRASLTIRNGQVVEVVVFDPSSIE